jgi:tRNA pseudouridine13 synthase
MRAAHPLEQTVGIGIYASDPPGIGGRLREEPSDFRVQEVESIEPEAIGVDPAAYEYLVIRATLENWDTNDFARELSDRLGISRSRIAWAGTKDRRAVTTQLFTLKGVEPASLPTIRGAEVEAVGRLGRALEFGDLAGNRFAIRVRDVSEPARSAEITDALRQWGGPDWSVGVPNFFGQQRFGSERAITHLVGRRILDGDWEGAVMAYVGKPSEHEPEETRQARAFVEETRNWAGAIDRFHEGLRFERAILSALAGGASYREALEELPTNLQRLFVHAAQSDLFNRIVTLRVRRDIPLGTPVPGDIVCFTETRGDMTIPDAARLQTVTEDRIDVVTRHCERGRAYVTAPLIGAETTLADGEPGDLARSVLAEAEVSPIKTDLPEPYHSAGTRRPVLVRTNLETTVRSNEDSVTMRFALPKGSYATVLLREYLKCDPRDL